MSTTKTISETVASVGISITTIATWAAGVLPPLAALVSIAWIVYQWWHSRPMLEWRRRRGYK